VPFQNIINNRQGEGGVIHCGQWGESSSDADRSFCCEKPSDFSKIMVDPHGQRGEGSGSADILQTRGEINFGDFLRRLLWKGRVGLIDKLQNKSA